MRIKMYKYVQKLNLLIWEIENRTISLIFNQKFPPESYNLLHNIQPSSFDMVPRSSFSLKDIVGDGFLWASPRNRRTIERRWSRKFGFPEQIYKLLTPKTNIRVCKSCGHDHEVGVLCPNCYQKVLAETKIIQNKIEKELGLNPVEQDVIVLYEGEKGEEPNEFWKGKRIIEMNKPRPMWFSKNLMQKTTQPSSISEEVKPNNLG